MQVLVTLPCRVHCRVCFRPPGHLANSSELLRHACTLLSTTKLSLANISFIQNFNKHFVVLKYIFRSKYHTKTKAGITDWWWCMLFNNEAQQLRASPCFAVIASWLLHHLKYSSRYQLMCSTWVFQGVCQKIYSKQGVTCLYDWGTSKVVCKLFMVDCSTHE